jgi:cephalosporin-C deacetylase-like acetyl esterase
MLIGVGLVDEVCPPTGCFAAINQIKSPKELIVLPTSGHQDVNGSQSPYNDRLWKVWLPALQRGGPAPVGQ